MNEFGPDKKYPRQGWYVKTVPVWAEQQDGDFIINTLEGKMVGKPGDWIMTGIAGEKWPIKDYIFRETYEHQCGYGCDCEEE